MYVYMAPNQVIIMCVTQIEQRQTGIGHTLNVLCADSVIDIVVQGILSIEGQEVIRIVVVKETPCSIVNVFLQVIHNL